MAKQQKPKVVPQPKKQTESGVTGVFNYILRNLAIIAVLLILFFIFWSKFSEKRRYTELTSEFYRERARNPNSAHLREVYNEIMAVQPSVIADTGFFARMTRGYHWAINDMALGSFNDIKEREEEIHQMRMDSTPAALLDAKRSMKIGLYPFIKEIIRQTPDTAIILLPPGDSAISNNGKWNFIYDPEWMEYFLYPRLCVASGAEYQHADLAKRVTHVVIIEGKGYDRLKYDVPMGQRPREAILPIDHPPGYIEQAK